MSGYWSPASLALLKSLAGLALFTRWFVVEGKPIFGQEAETIIYQVVFGVIGIAIGDTGVIDTLNACLLTRVIRLEG